MTLAEKVKYGIINTREYVFVQGQANILEKTLGENEILSIRPQCLIAFSSTVQIKRKFHNEFTLLGGLV